MPTNNVTVVKEPDTKVLERQGRFGENLSNKAVTMITDAFADHRANICH